MSEDKKAVFLTTSDSVEEVLEANKALDSQPSIEDLEAASACFEKITELCGIYGLAHVTGAVGGLWAGAAETFSEQGTNEMEKLVGSICGKAAERMAEIAAFAEGFRYTATPKQGGGA